MRALVLSGGGSKGAYQVGALKYILGECNIKYDAFCGVSVGALNCAFLSMFKFNEEKESINLLLDIWNNLDSSKIYKRWYPFGRWHALWKKSFFDSSPLYKLVKNGDDSTTSYVRKTQSGIISITPLVPFDKYVPDEMLDDLSEKLSQVIS